MSNELYKHDDPEPGHAFAPQPDDSVRAQSLGENAQDPKVSLNAGGERRRALTPARIAQVLTLLAAIGVIVLTFAGFPVARQVDRVIPDARRTPMPDFTLRDLHGAAWSLSAHRGQIVLVNFWATWCPPCRAELPTLIRVARNRRVNIAGISMDQDGAAGVEQFAHRAGINYPVLLPPSTFKLADSIDVLPTTFLVDRRGKIAREYFGEINEQTVEQDLNRLLAEP